MSDERQGAGRYITYLFEDLAELREAAAEWEEDPELFELECRHYADLWAYNVIGHDLRAVQRRRQAGALTKEEENFYRQLQAELLEAVPILEKLGFSRESLRFEVK